MQLESWLDSQRSLFKIATKIWIELPQDLGKIFTQTSKRLLLESWKDFHWNIDKFAIVHTLHKVVIRIWVNFHCTVDTRFPIEIWTRFLLEFRQDGQEKESSGIWTSFPLESVQDCRCNLGKFIIRSLTIFLSDSNLEKLTLKSGYDFHCNLHNIFNRSWPGFPLESRQDFHWNLGKIDTGIQTR